MSENMKEPGKTIFMLFCHFGLAVFIGTLFGTIVKLTIRFLCMETTSLAEETMQLYFTRTMYNSIVTLLLPVVTKLIYRGLCKLDFRLNKKLLAVLISSALYFVFCHVGVYKYFFIALVVSYVTLELPLAWAYGMCILAILPGWIRYFLCDDIHTITIAMQNVTRAEDWFETIAAAVGVAVSFVSFRHGGKEKVAGYIRKMLED